MKCAHCRQPGADNVWDLTACADDGKKRRRRLCDACDLELNRIAMTFLRIPQAKAKLAKYAKP